MTQTCVIGRERVKLHVPQNRVGDSDLQEVIVYQRLQNLWKVAILGEELVCQRERGNASDAYAVYVAVIKSGVVVGHLPRKVSCIPALFIRREGVIRCQVIRGKKYSYPKDD